ncbi:hypothetical protein JCM19237_4396 [Photobacterium aphoticum]|uniref:Uncharacterized protein n=1 Tax=Photobacterium aphoticum TaxID=754436 RepID=A0A090QPG0_9GAMM|nr:hypothetical protein JCM19237_4396 [Photobacterium aphoticum]
MCFSIVFFIIYSNLTVVSKYYKVNKNKYNTLNKNKIFAIEKINHDDLKLLF